MDLSKLEVSGYTSNGSERNDQQRGPDGGPHGKSKDERERGHNHEPAAHAEEPGQQVQYRGSDLVSCMPIQT